MKTFHYNRTLYIFDVVLTGAVALATLLVFWIYFREQSTLLFLVTGVCVYTFWNCFVSKVHPQSIVLGDEILELRAFNQTKRFNLNKLEKYNVREFPSSGKIYLRIDRPTVFTGRYWINTKNYDHSKELFQLLLDLDYQMNPHSLKSRAKKVNSEYLKKMEEK